MRKILKQTGKAFCYFTLFLGMQVVVSFMGMFVYGIVLGIKAGMTGQVVDQQLLSVQITEAGLKNAVLLAMVADLLSILFLMIFFNICKKKWYREANLNRISMRSVPMLVIWAIGLACCTNGVLNLLPVSILNDYIETSGNMLGEFSILNLFAEVIVFPLAEEFFFRGIILSRLKKAMPLPVAIILSSIAFGAIHGQITWVIYAFIIGCVFAVVAERNGSIASSMVMHMVFNLFGVVLSLWEGEGSVIGFVVMVLFGMVVLAVSGYVLYRSKENLNNGRGAFGGSFS